MCSFFVDLVVVNQLSDLTMQLFLPFLVLAEPKLEGISCYVLKGLLGLREHQFQELAVCPTCASLKSLAELQDDSQCRYAPFGTDPCNKEMGKRIRSLSGEVFSRPLKTFVFNGVANQLSIMLARPFRAAARTLAQTKAESRNFC